MLIATVRRCSVDFVPRMNQVRTADGRAPVAVWPVTVWEQIKACEDEDLY